jgi:NADH-quinone oxidoreductase subunit G
VLLVGFEPEEESPIVFLRLRKAVRKRGQKVYAVATHASRGLGKLRGALLPAAPGTETEWLEALAEPGPLSDEAEAAAEALRLPGAVLLLGERLAGVPGAYSAALRLARATGCEVAWIPRRAGERGAVEAGALPGLLPGGRPVTDPVARARTAELWGLGEGELPTRYGRDTGGMLAAAVQGDVEALLVGGVDPGDLPDPAAAEEALDATFVVSLELRPSAVTARADVVLPVAAVPEKSGSFLDWEGRLRPFETALRPDQLMYRHQGGDLRVLHMLADALDLPLGLPDVTAARRELERFGVFGPLDAAAQEGWSRAEPPTEPSRALPRPAAGEAVLGGWRQLLDEGTLQQGEPALAGTRHPALARLSPATAAEIGVADGAPLTVGGPAGAVTLPLAITPELPDRVVWLPLNSTPGGVQRGLGVIPGRIVSIAPAGAPEGEED